MYMVKKLYRRNGVAKSRFMICASKMPGKDHWPDRSVEFDYRNSEVVKWLLDQPEVWGWMFQKASDMGVLVFDASTKKWYGVDTEEGRKIAGVTPEGLSDKDHLKSS